MKVRVIIQLAIAVFFLTLATRAHARARFRILLLQPMPQQKLSPLIMHPAFSGAAMQPGFLSALIRRETFSLRYRRHGPCDAAAAARAVFCLARHC